MSATSIVKNSKNWREWPVSHLTTRFNAFREGLMKPPVQFETVRRYRNGLINRNSGYEDGGTKLFKAYARLLDA